MCYMQDILESKLSVNVIINLHTLHTAKQNNNYYKMYIFHLRYTGSFWGMLICSFVVVLLRFIKYYYRFEETFEQAFIIQLLNHDFYKAKTVYSP